MEQFPKWIEPKMINKIRGFNLDAYLMALEGWRRGLTLTWYLDPTEETDLEIIGFNPIGKSFSLESKDKKHYFYRSRGDYVSNDAVKLVHHKYEAKKVLEKNNVQVPRGFTFHQSIEFTQLLKEIKKNKVSYPLVLKPILGSLGKGIVTNIQDEQSLEKALEQVRNNTEYEDFIVEEHIEGREFRLYVVHDEVVVATERVHGHIVGDGEQTVEQLIEEKNKTREQNPYLRSKLIEIQNELIDTLKKQKVSLDSTLEEGRKVYISEIGNITRGGDPVDVTEILDSSIKNEAIKAVQSIKGMAHGAVDLIVQDNKPYIIEINATAGISIHMFPHKGTPINVPEKILDFYFPETKGKSQQLQNMYFRYQDISVLLRNSYADKVTIKDAPQGPLKMIRYIIKGKVQGVGYRQWIRKQAVLKGIHGYTRNLSNGNVVVVVASDDEQLIKDFKQTCYQGPKKAKVEDVKELSWKKAIQLGFVIKKTE